MAPKKFGPKLFDQTMEYNGGANNAYTREDITAYTNWFPSSATEVIFDLEADRIATLSIDPKMVESERGVVLSERSTGLENSPWRMLGEAVQGLRSVLQVRQNKRRHLIIVVNHVTLGDAIVRPVNL